MLLLKSFKKIQIGRWCAARGTDGSHLSKSNLPSLSLRAKVCHLSTRIYVRLLGPCFKTGRMGPFCQHLERVCGCKPTRERHHTEQYLCRVEPPTIDPQSPARGTRCNFSSVRRRRYGRQAKHRSTSRWTCHLPAAFLPPARPMLTNLRLKYRGRRHCAFPRVTPERSLPGGRAAPGAV